MSDMLSRALFDNEDNMVSEDEEIDVGFFESARLRANRYNTPALNELMENDYEGEWLLIGRFLSTMALDLGWTKDEAGWI